MIFLTALGQKKTASHNWLAACTAFTSNSTGISLDWTNDDFSDDVLSDSDEAPAMKFRQSTKAEGIISPQIFSWHNHFHHFLFFFASAKSSAGQSPCFSTSSVYSWMEKVEGHPPHGSMPIGQFPGAHHWLLGRQGPLEIHRVRHGNAVFSKESSWFIWRFLYFIWWFQRKWLKLLSFYISRRLLNTLCCWKVGWSQGDATRPSVVFNANPVVSHELSPAANVM